MDIAVLNHAGAIDRLTFVRLAGVVRVLHQGRPVGDVPVPALLRHLARRSSWPWVRRRRCWHDLEIGLTPDRKVTVAVRGRIVPNTLVSEELQGLQDLLSPDPDPSASPIPRTGAARYGGAQPR